MARWTSFVTNGHIARAEGRDALELRVGRGPGVHAPAREGRGREAPREDWPQLARVLHALARRGSEALSSLGLPGAPTP